ncbi:MAG: hypothetical protein ACI8RZ_003400 [Myxococcota bacterium]|jgi:hypothetical protein
MNYAIPILVIAGLVATAASVTAGLPWWVIGLIGLPSVLWGPGYGLACWLNRAGRATELMRLIDAAWIGMALAWIDIAIIREVGLRGEDAELALIGMSAGWAVLGLIAGRRHMLVRSIPKRELVGSLAVLAVLVGLIAWKGADLARPLDGHWYLKGADNEGHQPLELRPGMGWASTEQVGWPESGALHLVPEPNQTAPTLVAEERVRGRLVVAVRGPIGSRITIGDKTAVVEAAMTEEADEGPVRRYLTRGVAAISTHVELEPGQAMALEVEGDSVYLFPGTDAVWSMHAAGTLRYVHYYQLLNQVENQVWAEEILDSRRFTWNQPPGWSPLLATSVLLVQPDLPGANALFLWVLVLVGATSVRLISLLAPGAPLLATLIPAGMVASHGLLMIEPGSTNFPDSLFAAALLGVAVSLAAGRTAGFAAMGMIAGMLRWPGVITASILAGVWWWVQGESTAKRIGILWGLAALGGLAAFIAVTTGDAEDLAFVLYFETFPEHWHGEYSIGELLGRIPGFYATWIRYTGGALLLALPMVIGAPTPERRALRFLLVSIGLYSLFLCTIDHHPTHYFLPLVGFSGPILAVAATTLRRPQARGGLVILWLIGLLIFLKMGQV